MSVHLIDANVLLDIATADPNWMNWSREQIRLASTNGTVAINPIIYAEIAPAFATASDLDAWIGANVFARLPLPYAAGWLAAQAFIAYRRAGGSRLTLLPDFLHRCARADGRARPHHARRRSISNLLSRDPTHHAVIAIHPNAR